jgi:hypothetical protein
MSMIDRRMLLTGMLALPVAASARALAAGTAYAPRQSDRPETLSGDEPGFSPMFNGDDLDGWEGDSRYWRVENGVMVGEVTPDTVLASNTFLVWRGGAPGDFELKVEFRVSPSGNSGINYRSTLVDDPVTPSNRYAMRGYQFDIDGANDYTGNNYEEKGRLFLAERGQVTRVLGTRTPIVLSRTGAASELVAGTSGAWNTAYLIARGNVLMHHLNGRLMSMVIDEDSRRPRSGLIGVQVHVGPPMRVEYRNWRIKQS